LLDRNIMGCGASAQPRDDPVELVQNAEETAAADKAGMSQDEAAVKIQTRARGISDRNKVEQKKRKLAGNGPDEGTSASSGLQQLKMIGDYVGASLVDTSAQREAPMGREEAAIKLQSRARGMNDRTKVGDKRANLAALSAEEALCVGEANNFNTPPGEAMSFGNDAFVKSAHPPAHLDTGAGVLCDEADSSAALAASEWSKASLPSDVPASPSSLPPIVQPSDANAVLGNSTMPQDETALNCSAEVEEKKEHRPSSTDNTLAG